MEVMEKISLLLSYTQIFWQQKTERKYKNSVGHSHSNHGIQ